MGKLIDALENLHVRDIYPFHMPGHKRQTEWINNPYQYDITEIEGFDDLHNPKEILKELQSRLEELYKCQKVFLGVNGSTGGILASIAAVIDMGDNILISRNCHKSVYNGIFLRKGKVEYIYPQIDSKTGITKAVTANEVENMLIKNPTTKAVVITSPTYEGIMSNVDAIAKVVHKFDAVLIVDAAHGAHIGLDEGTSMADSKADVVIMSLHKTLPCFTQTAIVCINNLNLCEKISRYISMYETTSPSYLFMMGVEKFLDYIDNGQIFSEFNFRLKELRRKLSAMNNIKLYEPEEVFDETKIVFDTSNCSLNGVELKSLLLEKYDIELEMASNNYALAMTSCMDSKKGFERLVEAMYEIDKHTISQNNVHFENVKPCVRKLQAWECENIPKRKCQLEDALDCVSANYIYAYPPGVPILVPGEVISESVIRDITIRRDAGVNLIGLDENSIIQVIQER